MSTLFVAGKFDRDGGRASGYMRKLSEALLPHFTGLTTINGGNISLLRQLIDSMSGYDTIIWMADVPNDVPKMVESIKTRYPRKMLVTSKRNLSADSYSLQEVVSRALAIKSNLVLMLTGTRGSITGTVVDPLGVTYCHEEPQVEKVAQALADRVSKLSKFTRVGSRSVGPALGIPDQPEFFAIIREHAERFHEIIHGVGHERMLGNASFRCAKGFPSFRTPEIVYVSRRNIDKRYVDKTAFVGTYLQYNGSVDYYGEIKPSVDTPIQLRLYQALPEIRFMLHSHTYVEGAPCTAAPVPCGAIEEVDEIMAIIDPSSADFAVNIKGHGSIVFASCLDTLKNVPWIPRPIPERCGTEDQ